MPKTLNLPIFDVGAELEFFITPKGKPWIIFNARKELEDILGFNIDQNHYSAGNININKDYNLVTDGTACELRWFGENNKGVLPTNHKDIIDSINFIRNFDKNYCPYNKEGDMFGHYHKRTKFDSPNNVYSSGKMIVNAYTNTYGYGKKQEEQPVTIRTAGLHFHFSVSDYAAPKHPDVNLNDLIFWPYPAQHVNSEDNRKHTNALVKIMDEIYQANVVNHPEHYFNPASKKRVDEYQKLGDYRVRAANSNITKKPTLEYRQFDSWLDWKLAQKCLDIFQYQAKKYLEGVINAQ